MLNVKNKLELTRKKLLSKKRYFGVCAHGMPQAVAGQAQTHARTTPPRPLLLHTHGSSPIMTVYETGGHL